MNLVAPEDKVGQNKPLPAFALVLLGLTLCAIGCDQKPSARDAKITKIEARVVEVEARYQDLNDRFTNLLTIVKEMNLSNQRALSELSGMAVEQRENWEKMERLISEMMTNRQFAVPRYGSAQPQSIPRANYGATRDGVPLAVYNQIALEAAKQWPSDYEMQAYTIKNQVEAYRKLHP